MSPNGGRNNREFVKGFIKDQNAMMGEMERKMIYGSEAFIKRFGKEYKFGGVIRPRGRPGKEE